MDSSQECIDVLPAPMMAAPMSLSSPPPADPPVRLWPEGWACALAGCVGAAAILVMMGLRSADLWPGVGALAVVAAATAALVTLVRREAAVPADVATPAVDDSLRRAALAGALEGLPDPLIVISSADSEEVAGARVVYANAQARTFLRIPGEGVPLATVMRQPEVIEAADEALFGQMTGEAAYDTGGPSPRYWRALARPLPGAPGGERLALVVLTDETASRRTERMRSDFLANASHELRTPLASLSGFIETLRGHAKDDGAARDRFLEIMAAQADRMARLVADLMSLSRIELNEHIRPKGRVDVGMAVMDVLDALAPQAAAAGVTLRPQFPPTGQAQVVGDRDQIVQVAQNLVDNGVKYAGVGGTVDVVVEAVETVDTLCAAAGPQSARLTLLTPDRAQGPFIVIRVTDSGPGIPREHLPRLTERFYRVEGQKSGERLGTGLGLAIVKHIVNRHGGGLAVETTPGEGATFAAYFPAAPAD